MDTVPAYVSIVFILTTFAAIGFFLQVIKTAGINSLPSRILVFLLPLWIIFQGVLAVGGFYQNISGFPPRVALFGPFPAVLLIISYFLLFRKSFIERLPLRLLTLVHIVRIPVELVLYWLFLDGVVPRVMTFAGRNYDIASGILALGVYFIAFRRRTTNKWLLIGFNTLGLLLLVNVVSIAILSLPTPFQQLALDQPNRAVLYFPYIWLPTIIVPVVLFSHLASLWKLFRSNDN
jgi:hypothetical protein